MKNIFFTSNSKTKVWRRCRQAYWYRYVERLRRKQKSRALKFGSVAHELVETLANGGNMMMRLKEIARHEDKLFRSQQEEWGNLVDDMRVIMTEYEDFWEDYDLKYIKLRGKRSEFTFQVEIAPGIVAEGKIDRIAESDDLRFLVETKTFSQMPNDDHRWRDLQPALYLKVNQMVKLPPIDGVLWDYIRSKPPSFPQILKSGKVSARGLDSLPTRVYEFMKSRGLSAKDKKYAPLLKQVIANRKRYFQRTRNIVKLRVVDALYADFVNTSKEMRELHGQKDATFRNMERHCDWCEFEPLCRAALLGLDEKFLKKKDYEVRDEIEREEPDFEG
jgi:CRISPR/Cas system-associated exonuclease Cas4 (RecB family)